MSAIVSLLRVMTLRDAEAIVLEAGKIPQLRRRGQVEALAMPALDGKMLADFVAPLIAGKPIEAGPVMVTFTDGEGVMYPVTVETVAAGLRLVVRRSAPKAAAAAGKRGAGTAAAAGTGTGTGAGTGTGTGAGTGTGTGAGTGTAAGAAVGPRAESLAIRERLGELLGPLVAIAREREASDVVLSTGQSPRIRVEGRVETLEVAIDDDELAGCVMALAGTDAGVSADLSLEISGARLRVNAFDHLDGHAIAARLIRERVPSLGDLALPPELASIVDHRDGLVLVCGPTGSGKSTTLAALIDQLDQRRAAHVITLEDPIEYRFAPRRCIVHQRELGTHIPTFAAGLRAALREAPDVILLGELRDRETIAAALTAAETGHLVLATLHAPNAVGAIDRVIDIFPDTQQRQIRTQLAGSLRTIVTQYLLPRRDGGRAAAIELVPVTPAVANIVRKGELQTLATAIQSGRDAGMIPLERSLARLVDSGAVTAQAARRVASDHELLAAMSNR